MVAFFRELLYHALHDTWNEHSDNLNSNSTISRNKFVRNDSENGKQIPYDMGNSMVPFPKKKFRYFFFYGKIR